ncbi:MAG: hypothetical protein A3H98_01250 [Bacteroidetes bacterium RIFCSPLOWO2_02_FULL_36_8]|nr:MAG: hypothetical protein A3H98_01250 [Bacteroidetes bacterium RIFCSPLOWO2_02_FULL_36_8]OFY71327.1 MAG: hypothetical protein A3G23_03990 [Bacteroidetes bacterium RIFCSPLOWO2_12_FULL_37_12]
MNLKASLVFKGSHYYFIFMKLIYIILFLISQFSLASDGAGEIRKKNKLKAEGTKAFQNKEYKKAIEKFSYLLDSLKNEDDHVRMNLATATLLSGDSSAALLQYQKVLASTDKKLRSQALQQSSVLAFQQKQYKDALELSKEALKQDPSNKDARFNYELLKKILKDNPQNQDNKKQDQQNKDQQDKQDQKNKDHQDKQNQQNKDEQNKKDKQNQQDKQGQNDKKENQENEKQGDKNKEDEKNSKDQQDKKDKEKEKSNEGKEGKKDDKEQKKDSSNAIQPNQSKPVKPLKISPDKAKMILEALRSAEKQYLQQLQKKPEKSRKREGPDW